VFVSAPFVAGLQSGNGIKELFLMNNYKDLEFIIKHNAQKVRKKHFDATVKLMSTCVTGITISIVMIFIGDIFFGSA